MQTRVAVMAVIVEKSEFWVLNLATLMKTLDAQMKKAATDAVANTGLRRDVHYMKYMTLKSGNVKCVYVVQPQPGRNYSTTNL